MRGIFAAGANCSWTGHDENTKLDAAGLIKLLEDGAVIISHDDRMKEKNAFEIACYDLGDSCTFEMKQTIKRIEASLGN